MDADGALVGAAETEVRRFMLIVLAMGKQGWEPNLADL